jgi:ATP synthase protein I
MAPSDSGDDRDGEDRSSTESIRKRLDKLGHELDEAEKKHQPPDYDTGARTGALGYAFRLGAEMVVAIVVSGVIGWTLDSWLETSPAFLILFLVLGTGAGILGAVRSARRMQRDYRGGDKS